MSTSQRTRDAAALLLLLAASIPLAVLARHIAYDDAWITYRYAWNLASGNGFVYNLGERFLGTSAPGYAALLALGGLISPDLVPAVSGVLCALAHVAAGLGLYAFARTTDDWLVGLAAGLFLVVNPVSLEAFGGEMPLQLALVIWAFVAEAHRRWMWAAGLALAATLIRPDGIVPLGLLLAHQTFVRRQIPWREIAVVAVVLGVWHGALWLYFGAPMPATAGAKSAQRLSGIWRPFGSDLFDWFKALTIYPSHWYLSRPAPGFTTTVWLAGAGLFALLVYRRWWMLMLWPVAYMLAYRQLHLPFYHWYALVPLVAIAIAAGAATGGIARLATWIADRVTGATDSSRAASRRLAIELATLLVVVGVAIWPTARFSGVITSFFPNSVERAYAGLGHWLAANTPPGASVGYLEVGIFGYHSRRPIIDPLGLVNPGVTPHVAKRDLLWAYRHYRPDYIVYNPVFFPEYLGIVRDEPWFKTEYVYVTDLESGRGADIPLSIYRRVTTPASR